MSDGPDDQTLHDIGRDGGAHLNGGAKSHLIDFTEIVAKPVRWAWVDRVALAKLTALSGRPKIGKGLVYSHLIAEVTRGTLAGDLDGPRDVILVTTEDDPGDTLKPRLMAAGADLSRVSLFRMGPRDEPVPFRVPHDAAALAAKVEQTEAALVVVDPLMEFLDGKVDSHKSHPVRQAVAALNQIARAHGCAVLLIFHLNKGISTDPLLRHEGSAAFTQIVRGGLMLGHDPDDPDGEDGAQRVLAVSSSNLAAIAPSLIYRIDTAHVDGDTGEAITTARMVHIGESAVGAHDLLRGRPGEEELTAAGEARVRGQPARSRPRRARLGSPRRPCSAPARASESSLTKTRSKAPGNGRSTKIPTPSAVERNLRGWNLRRKPLLVRVCGGWCLPKVPLHI